MKIRAVKLVAAGFMPALFKRTNRRFYDNNSKA